MSRIKYALPLIMATLLFFVSGAVAGLRKDGKYLVDSEGNRVQLRGMGLGGWLVPEGYMLKIPGYGSPTSIREKILDLLGEEDTDTFYRIYRENYVSEADIELINSWGFNSIRLPFHYDVLTPREQPGVWIEEGFAIIDSLLAWCEKREMYLILDMHCAPGGQNSDNISDSDGEAKLWTIPSNQDRTVEIWRRIAERYAGEEWIGGYDLLNEPVMPAGYTTLDLRALYMRISAAIREVDTDHLIFIEGNIYATDMTDLTPPWEANLVYSFHKYWNEPEQGTISSYLNLRNQWSYPLWMGESGENSNPWFHRTVTLLEKNEIGWAWWTHKKIGTLTSPLSSPISVEYQRVLDYWEGDAGRPTDEFSREALFGMAEDLAIDSCVFRPDVLAALFDPEFGTTPKPFTVNTVPGTVACVNYDLGDNGIAYSDKEYIKTRWDVDQPWNLGWNYRNDGVDIERNAGDYNVGWIETGEWIRYTLDVVYDGEYDLDVEVAAISKGGAFRIYVDGIDVSGVVDVPNTGGWQSWQQVTVEGVELSNGTGVLRIEFPVGGFNLKNIVFIPKETGIYHSLNTYTLVGQNYPNPFNVTTRIPILLARDTEATLSIYNLKGELVRHLSRGILAQGKTEIVWNGKNDSGAMVSSGIYFIRVIINDNSYVLQTVFLK